jgi:RHS repeat-associated protein
MESTASHPRLSRQRLASRPRCKSTRSRCRPIQNHKRSLHRNQQYSIYALTDGSGNISERYAYTAYGALTITDASGTIRTASTADNRYTFTGREWDEALALYHYRARMYDSVPGRFASRDPIGYRGGWDLYGGYFAFQSLVDPMGLAALSGCAELCWSKYYEPSQLPEGNHGWPMFHHLEPGVRGEMYTNCINRCPPGPPGTPDPPRVPNPLPSLPGGVWIESTNTLDCGTHYRICVTEYDEDCNEIGVYCSGFGGIEIAWPGVDGHIGDDPRTPNSQPTSGRIRFRELNCEAAKRVKMRLRLGGGVFPDTYWPYANDCWDYACEQRDNVDHDERLE